MRQLIHRLIDEVFVGAQPTYRQLVGRCLDEFNTPTDNYFADENEMIEYYGQSPMVWFWPIAPLPPVPAFPVPWPFPLPVPVFW